MLLREHEAADSAWQLPPPPPVNVQDAYNAQFEHTVAQPFCHSSQHALFTTHLGDHLRDVLFPMAHAVHEAPSQVICARWVVERGAAAVLVVRAVDRVLRRPAEGFHGRRVCERVPGRAQQSPRHEDARRARLLAARAV
jgi:hypothetical protein